jgi:hypothetical protein
MKRLVVAMLVVTLFIGFGIQNASAASKSQKSQSASNGYTPSQSQSATSAYTLEKGTLGFGVTTSSDMTVYGKYLVIDDLAIMAGLGLNMNGGDTKGTDISLGAGARKYFKIASLAPFVGGLMAIAVTNDSNNTDLGIYAEGGAEYFLTKQFSFEGAVRLGYTSTTVKATDATPEYKSTTFGTTRASIGFNFYF